VASALARFDRLQQSGRSLRKFAIASSPRTQDSMQQRKKKASCGQSSNMTANRPAACYDTRIVRLGRQSSTHTSTERYIYFEHHELRSSSLLCSSGRDVDRRHHKVTTTNRNSATSCFCSRIMLTEPSRPILGRQWLLAERVPRHFGVPTMRPWPLHTRFRYALHALFKQTGKKQKDNLRAV